MTVTEADGDEVVIVVDAAPTAPATKQEPSKPEAVLRDVGRWLLGLVLSPFAELGALSRLFGQTLFWGVRPPYRARLFVEAMEFIGIGSIFIVSLTSLFVGGVLALQLVDGFRDFGAENQTGAVIGLALAREVGPVFAALMVTSRAGSAMTTELGSMRVTNQIDALVTIAAPNLGTERALQGLDVVDDLAGTDPGVEADLVPDELGVGVGAGGPG